MSEQVLSSLHDVVSAEHPTYIGGGTDIMPLLKNEVRDDKDFVFLKKIPELHVLEEKDGELIIGATMTLTELAESELLNSRYAAIAQAASLTASPQIRNIATVGGNIMQDRRCIYFNHRTCGAAALPTASRPAAAFATRSRTRRSAARSTIPMSPPRSSLTRRRSSTSKTARRTAPTSSPSSSATAWPMALPATSTCPSSSRAFSSPRRKRASAAAFISTRCARRSTSRSSTSRSAAAAIAPRVWPRARSRPIRS